MITTALVCERSTSSAKCEAVALNCRVHRLSTVVTRGLRLSDSVLRYKYVPNLESHTEVAER